MPESQIEKLTEQAPQVSNNFSLVEAIDRLTNNDVAGYRAEFEKLMQRNAAGDSQALVDVLFAAFASDDATNDWPALRDLALSSIDPGKYESGTETGNANLQANQCFVWPLIGGVLYRTNDLQQAVEILEESDQVHNEYESSSPGVDSSYYQVYRWYNWLFLSMSHHRLGNHQQSQKYFIRAATQIPRLLKNIEFQPGKLHEQTVSLLYREAFETIEFDPDEWIVDTSDDSELVARAEVYLLNGQRQKALLDYTAAIEQNPRNSLSRRLRAELLETERRFPEALADFSKAIELEPNRGELWNRRASCQYNSGRFEQAIDDWNRALELNPHQFWARLRRGLCHAKLGNRDLALRDYLATRVDPPPCGWRIERGKRLFDIQQFDEAVKDLSANPNDAGALRLRGLAYCQLGEFEKALADFDRLTTLNKNSDAWMYRAAVYRAMGDDKRAEAEFEQYLQNSSQLRLNPEDRYGYNERGWAYYYKQQFGLALKDANHDLELRPWDANYLLGHIHLAQGDCEQAINDFQNLIEINPKSCWGYQLKGWAQLRWQDGGGSCNAGPRGGNRGQPGRSPGGFLVLFLEGQFASGAR